MFENILVLNLDLNNTAKILSPNKTNVFQKFKEK